MSQDDLLPPQPLPPPALALEWAGETLALLPGRGLWWPAQETLLIADPHFGKAATFRLSGIPVPESAHAADLLRLSHMLLETKARRLVVLGDFLHARLGRSDSTLKALEQWREEWPRLEIVLVLGNHDRHAGPPFPSLRIECREEPFFLPPFACCHHPQALAGRFVLAGHLHPTYRLALPGGGITSPCFHVSASQMILPAFGSFTGGCRVRPTAGERIYLVGPEELVALRF